MPIEDKRKTYLAYANSNTNDNEYAIAKEGLLFVRSTNFDPKSGSSYMPCDETKYKQKDGSYKLHTIMCVESKGSNNKTFVYNEGNFVASTTNLRSVDLEKKYYGDSSSFTFGTCQKYFD